MRWRIALYSPTRSVWGGSFQYAKAVAEALALLDPQAYEVATGLKATKVALLIGLADINSLEIIILRGGCTVGERVMHGIAARNLFF